jgi:beta-lactamase class A
MSAPASSIHVPVIGEATVTRPRWRFRATALLAIAVSVLGLGIALAPLEVNGRVMDSEWNPVAGATAALIVDGKVAGRAASARTGWFHLRGGHGYQQYAVAVSAPGYVTTRLDRLTGTALVHTLGSLSGQLLDDLGTPVGGATVTLRQAGHRELVVGTTDAGGWFSLRRTLEPGTFHLLAEAPDHESVEATLRVDADDARTFNAVLSRLVGTLTLTTDPPGLQMLLDGKPMPDCPATPCSATVVVGRHVLSVDSELYVPWQQQVDVQRKAQLSVSPKLERKTGTLVVNGPAGDLEVDGKVVGPGWKGQLPTGTHVVSYRGSSVWPVVKTAQVSWNQETSVTLAATAVATGDANAFISQMNAYLAGVGGQYGVYLQDLNSGREMGSGQNKVMETASVIKIPVALFTYKQSESGALKLDDPVTLQGSDFMGGTGILYGKAQSGDTYSYRDLVSYLIRYSDNTAWLALRRSLGARAIDAYAASIGAPDCHQLDNTCTPRETGLLLAALARGQLLNSDDTQALMQLLETTVYNDRINYYLGGTTIAHKVGMNGGVMNDAGVVFLPGHPFVISMFTYTGDGSTGIQAIRDVARAAAWFYSH